MTGTPSAQDKLGSHTSTEVYSSFTCVFKEEKKKKGARVCINKQTQVSFPAKDKGYYCSEETITNMKVKQMRKRVLT